MRAYSSSEYFTYGAIVPEDKYKLIRYLNYTYLSK